MGRYTGIIQKNARPGAFGVILAKNVVGLQAFFDVAASKQASGPGRLIKGARVSFEIGGNGRAIKIIRSYSRNSVVGRTKRFQAPTSSSRG
jgi:hypothetical protein